MEICLAVTSSEYSLLQIKTKLQITTSLLSTNYEKGVVTNYNSFKNYVLRTWRRPRGCGVMMVWVDNKRVDINWDVSPVSSPDIVLSHRGEFSRGNDHWPTPLNPLDF